MRLEEKSSNYLVEPSRGVKRDISKIMELGVSRNSKLLHLRILVVFGSQKYIQQKYQVK